MIKSNTPISKALIQSGLRSTNIFLRKNGNDLTLQSGFVYFLKSGEVNTFSSEGNGNENGEEYSFDVATENSFLVAPHNKNCRLRITAKSEFASIKQYSYTDFARIIAKDGPKNPVNAALLASVKLFSHHLSLLVTGHHQSHYVRKNKECMILGGETYTSDNSELWCYLDKKNVEVMDIINLRKDTLYLPMTEGIFFKANQDDTITVLNERQIVVSPHIKTILLSTLGHIFSIIPRALSQRHKDREAIDQTIVSTKRVHFNQAVETFRSLISKRRYKIDINPHASILSCAVFRVLHHIGVKGIEEFISSSHSADFDSLENISMDLGLRYRPLNLNGIWWKRELGALLGFYGKKTTGSTYTLCTRRISNVSTYRSQQTPRSGCPDGTGHS